MDIYRYIYVPFRPSALGLTPIQCSPVGAACTGEADGCGGAGAQADREVGHQVRRVRGLRG